MYASGVGRRLIGLFWRPALKQLRAFLVHPDEFDQVFDSEVSEGLDAMFSDAIDPDGAVFDLHFIGDVSQPVFVFAKILGNTVDGGNVMNLVDVHGHAARAEIAVAGVQFQGNSSSSR
ncbi:hypothetical protein SAMN05443247_07002 [Bradyrhizobium erythrophlei]|jgi:hypothetical protein|nr:hypothetical protein SAMN05443247_07002 [Bradyrhizobium erythrophlei]